MKNIKEIIILTILFCATVIVGWYLISPSVGDEKNLEIYENALTDYNSGNYSKAYYQFSLVKRGSDLKPYAIYKQGLSAQKLGDYKGAIRNYNKLIFSNTDKELLMRARYLKAQSLFELGEFDKAHGEFEGIIKKYPKTDYEITSHYFLGAIDIKEPKNSEKTADLFRYYLKNSHDGKYSVASGEKLALLNPTTEDNFLIAKAYYANGDYETAQKLLNLTNPQ